MCRAPTFDFGEAPFHQEGHAADFLLSGRACSPRKVLHCHSKFMLGVGVKTERASGVRVKFCYARANCNTASRVKLFDHTHARARLAPQINPPGGWDLARSRVFSQSSYITLFIDYRRTPSELNDDPCSSSNCNISDAA